MEMVNGYVFLDLTKSNVYAKALKALSANKPVVISNGSGAPYFVDSLTLDGTNVVITKGGKTITIANDNTITSVGEIQNHLYRHQLYCDENNFYLIGVVYTNFSTPITKDNISSLLSGYVIPMNAYNGDAITSIANVSLNVETNEFHIGGLFYSDGNLSQADNVLDELQITFNKFTDSVKQLF